MSRRGYTVVEVMMAMAILAVGATGVIAMQKATLIGNVRARDLHVGNAIASSWIERLRADSQRWLVNEDSTSTIGQTRWLNVVGSDFPTVAGAEGAWFRPAQVALEDISYLADVRGDDTTDPSVAGFCTHLRLTQLTPRMIRAEVRVYWLKTHGVSTTPQSGGTLGGVAFCNEDPALVGAERQRYHFVYMTSGIMANDSD
jgi:prepilin-type N-terminal cleavage/methylation domain-containing protein